MRALRISILISFFAATSFAENSDLLKAKLLKDASDGDLTAQVFTAELYYYGGGYYRNEWEQNYDEAFKWYSKAAKQNDKNAQFKTALMYYEGNGVRQNKSKAVQIIKEAINTHTIEGYDDADAVEILDKMLLEDLKNLSEIDESK